MGDQTISGASQSREVKPAGSPTPAKATAGAVVAGLAKTGVLGAGPAVVVTAMDVSAKLGKSGSAAASVALHKVTHHDPVVAFVAATGKAAISVAGRLAKDFSAGFHLTDAPANAVGLPVADHLDAVLRATKANPVLLPVAGPVLVGGTALLVATATLRAGVGTLLGVENAAVGLLYRATH